MRNAGAEAGGSPVDQDQATGREREEMIANQEGNQIWGDHVIEVRPILCAATAHSIASALHRAAMLQRGIEV